MQFTFMWFSHAVQANTRKLKLTIKQQNTSTPVISRVDWECCKLFCLRIYTVQSVEGWLRLPNEQLIYRCTWKTWSCSISFSVPRVCYSLLNDRLSVYERNISSDRRLVWVVSYLMPVWCFLYTLYRFKELLPCVARWPSDIGAGLSNSRSRVRIPDAVLPSPTLGKLFTHIVPVPTSSIVWYQPIGGDARRPGR